MILLTQKHETTPPPENAHAESTLHSRLVQRADSPKDRSTSAHRESSPGKTLGIPASALEISLLADVEWQIPSGTRVRLESVLVNFLAPQPALKSVPVGREPHCDKMDNRRSFDSGLMEQALPIPVQLYLWRQLRPFTRAKLGKLHEASCTFCQNAPGHHEMKEASTLFVYLFAPLSNHLKDIDFKSNLRLENGVKIWEPMNEYRHPENPCFTAHCRPKPRSLWWKTSRLGKQSTDIFVGVKKKNEDDETPPSQTISMCFTEQNLPANKQEDDNNWVSSPKDTVFPETIPEESSSTEDENVIYRMPFPDHDKNSDGVKKAEASILHVAMGRSSKSLESTLTIERVGFDRSDEKTLTTLQFGIKSKTKADKNEKNQESVKQKPPSVTQESEPEQNDTSQQNRATGGGIVDIRAATFMDVAVLRCLFISQYIGDTKVERKQSRFYSQSCAAPNPIITVTEHTPTPSPDYLKRQGSMDSQLDSISIHGSRLSSERKPSLTRSQTDSNITYLGDEIPEAPGSAYYITKEGDIDYQIVLKAVHSVALRDGTYCTLRVCESILNLVELLMEMGVLKQCFGDEASNAVKKKFFLGSMDSQLDSISIHGSRLSSERKPSLTRSQTDSNITYLGDEIPEAPGSAYYITKEGDIDYQIVLKAVHSVALRDGTYCTLRVCESILNLVELLMEMGVLKQCFGDEASNAGSGQDNEKQEHKHDSPVNDQDPRNDLEGRNWNAHALMLNCVFRVIKHLGCPHGCADGIRGAQADFCRSQVSSLLSKLFHSSSRQFSRTLRLMVRNQPISEILELFHSYVGFCVEPSSLLSPLNQKRNTLVTRFVSSSQEFKSQENISVYCDIKQFITYVKENHGGVFRRVALSGILDSSDKPNKRCNSSIITTRLQSLLETELGEENTKISQSPLGNLRKKHLLTPRQSERNLGIGETCVSRKARKSTRFQLGGIVNWFRREYGRTDSTDSHDSSESPSEGNFIRQASFHRGHYRVTRPGRGVGQTLQRAKRRMESKLNKIGFRKGKKKESLEEAPHNYFSRRNSMDLGDASRESEFVVLKERRLVPREAVFEGMKRFSFLLETCQPGSPHAPVVARASLLLECAHLVHQCNKGHWPTWMKINLPIFRPSIAMSTRNAPSGLRRTHVLQRAAGKLFYQWAEAISARLEEFMNEDKKNVDQIIALVNDESKQRELCPVALRMVACILLLEITAFLRETYQTLPKSSRLSTKERPAPWERMYSREANRRWSMALSSMGHSQTSAQSLQSIAGDRETAGELRELIERGSWSYANPITNIYHQPSDSIALDFRSERKISFVLHEPDNESEGSSKSTVTIQPDDTMTHQQQLINDAILSRTSDKKRVSATPSGRPFLLRRGTAGNTGSFKRRSLKLRRNTKEGKDMECEAYSCRIVRSIDAVRRADSIQSKRKVSSLSDRSDTSEQYAGEVSGEESPGILSDDQPPESPSDSNDTDDTNKNFPWMKVLVQFTATSNFFCSHQNFCHPYCHRRQMRACARLIKSVRKVYGEEFGIINGASTFDFDGDCKKDGDGKKDKRVRKVSDQTSAQVSPVRRKDSRSLVTATKTRKKQQTELIKKALQAQDDKKREERENFLITTIPITVQAAYEPSPVGDDHDEGNADDESGETQPRNTTHHGQSALSLFPSSLCSAIVQIINLLDDAAVSDDGNAVYEVAYQVIWSCLVEDSALFLRYVLERLTREKQELMFKILRHLIRFVPKLPQQAAFALYNYIIGYVMFYVRSPHEEGQKHIGTALSILWMCDASILLTANVPSAKKIIVHGPQDPDAGGIPSQFPVQEDTQFCQILRESLDFFGIEEHKHKEYFLVDYKTHQIHNPSSYVRDYYFFKRSQYPQLELIHMKPEDAFNALQRQELVHKFVEIGKVLLTWAILKNVDMVVQRVELLGLDVMHKFMWVRLIARMFEAMAGNFAYSGDIHLFLNVLNGAIILHSEDSCILRYVVATYINAAHNFKNIFSTNGYLLIMPTLLQLYSTHQTNKLVTTTVEYAVKQFYLMNRKPFILQMFGSVSTILDTDETSTHGEAHKVPSICLFNLLMSLETPSPDPLNIGELVKEEKPLKAIDFCYHDETEMVSVLDCISLCVMVIAYAADSIRGQQMLTILEAILPCYVQQIQLPTYNREGKTEKEIINQLAIAVKTLVNNSEALTKYYNGPQKSSPEHKGSSQRNYGKGPYSPGFEYEDEIHTAKYLEHTKVRTFYERDNDDAESSHKNEFRRPRDTLLNIVGDFVARTSVRLAELNKKSQDGKTIELLDSKCHVWSNDDMRPALTIILRRLDKTFSKIYKKASVRRNTDWEAASDLLKGIYETLSRYPYIAHFQYFKTLLSTCQALIVGDTGLVEVTSGASAALMSKIPPQHFCSTVLRLIALHVISLGDGYSLENVCGGSTMFASQTRTENMLLNLLIPLFLRVGTGRKDVPKLRPADLSFALIAVLNTLWPTGTKTMPMAMQNLKATTDMRAGSLTFAARDTKISTKLSMSLYQVAFLASIHLWNFLEFVVTHRTALYIQMLPFIVHKIGQPPISEHERNMQTIIRGKINGDTLAYPKSRGTLLGDLLHELRDMKEEIEDRKFEPKRSVVDMHPGAPNADGQPRTQRPSLLNDLWSGDLASKAHINRTPAETPGSHSTTLHSIQQSLNSGSARSLMPSQGSAPNGATRAMRRNIDGVVTLTAPYLKLSVLGSVSSGGSSTLKDTPAPDNANQVKSDENPPNEPPVGTSHCQEHCL
ncbi:Similar to unc80: Protein unc-80 homolog (Drosophila melanogaster) [Cotesia congregata]|uniref:Similar to unc80: Protein unc-80 homolog (Drosophila melanogaster) n=1 Tax=Cotesia congregata TaxID=51543 RepID=A0A8J2H5F3_COTCN|nr:Similar to unc80: Protein unc-80 homolog (Drosophila melanogaster) [Cotesia congregata]